MRNITISIFLIFISVLAVCQRNVQKVNGYFDYDNHPDYISDNSSNTSSIYLYKNGKYQKVGDIVISSEFFNDYDENQISISGDKEKGIIVVNAMRGASNKSATLVYYKYIENLNNWLLYKVENEERLGLDIKLDIKFYPYEIGIDGSKFKPNFKLYTEDSLSEKSKYEKILTIEYDSLRNLSSFKGYKFRYSYEDLYLMTKEMPITISNVQKYNDLAYYLCKLKDNRMGAVVILRRVIEKFPDRVVTYLNLADAYWLIDCKEDAKESYQKYIDLMKSQQKDLSIIPKRVYERLKQ